MNNYILSFITWLPAVGAILILALMKKDQSSLIKKFATAWFAIDFVGSLWLLKYNTTSGGMQFLEDHQWIPVIGARYQMGVDGVAVLLITLTTRRMRWWNGARTSIHAVAASWSFWPPRRTSRAWA